MAKWEFMPYGQNEIKQNPTQSEFFTTNEVGNIATGLIREAIQNSLDEYLYRGFKGNLQSDQKSVLIKIFISGEKYALESYQYAQYLEGLEMHLKAKGNGIRSLPDFTTEKMRFLVFEDFNTNGLVGEPNESKDVDIEDPTKKHNFYHFWRNIGITGKPEDKLGRWGIGKTVFPVSSKINSFWGLTVQHPDLKQLLLGQSVLKSHNLKDKPKDYGYRPYGYFATYRDDAFPYAIEDTDIIAGFKKTFKVQRNNESGLSIIIPFYREEITFKSIITAVILQYYFPIIREQLVVDITYEDNVISLSANNLTSVVQAYWDE
ncbi:MAG: hypothetical protein ACTHKV_07585, partial [Flavipsychrobacter sp.]